MQGLSTLEHSFIHFYNTTDQQHHLSHNYGYADSRLEIQDNTVQTVLKDTIRA